MKKQFFLLLTIIYSQLNLVNAQTLVQYNNEILFNEIHQEKIFVHFNSSFLLTGENLYYKIYCLNSKNNKLSQLSKIAYVVLIDSELNEVFKHKVKLVEGQGHGDFFIPTSLISGNYKIIAYTQWMRNDGDLNIFKEDISIVNPFNENQDSLVSKISDSNNSINNLKKAKKNSFVSFDLEKRKFKSREKVVVTINGLKNSESYGNYSLSVREKTPFRSIESSTSESSVLATKKDISELDLKPKNNRVFLPELRGELISGIVIDKISKQPQPDVKVSLSFLGKDNLFKMGNTNSSGRFYFNISENYQQPNARIKVINNPELYEVKLEIESSIKYKNISFSDFKIDKSASDFILEQSINNQIENAYSATKPNKINQSKVSLPFYNTAEISYNLDDFTRFSTLRETIIEIVETVSVRQRKGEYFLEFIWSKQINDTGLLPLVIFDGIIVDKHNDIINYNSRKIKSINVVKEKYLYGTQLFEGIISIESINGDFQSTNKKDNIVSLNLLKPIETKTYFNQVYDENINLKRIPDFRTQLLWMPNINLNTELEEVIFYTSDNKGQFEICLEGYTVGGSPVSIKEIITVE